MNMAYYCLNRNRQPNGDVEVHNEDTCKHLPERENRVSLGIHDDCESAVALAKGMYPGAPINGCYNCSVECHTS